MFDLNQCFPSFFRLRPTVTDIFVKPTMKYCGKTTTEKIDVSETMHILTTHAI